MVSMSQAKMTYDVGDECWITVAGTATSGPMQGRVIASFLTPYAIETQYIIHLADPNHPNMEVRDALRMSGSPDVPPPFYLSADQT